MPNEKMLGRVAAISGAARGQGRSHAVRLAQEGADIIALDICRQIASVPYPLASPEDLAETARLVEGLGRKIITFEADVRDYAAVEDALEEGVRYLGRLDAVSANAGIVSFGKSWELSSVAWRDMLDVNLTGVWHLAKAAVPHIRRSGGGSITLTSSLAGIKPNENIGHYVVAKHGVVGLMRTMALELAPEGIRVNALLPCSVNTKMVHNDAMYGLFAPDLPPDLRSTDWLADRFMELNALPIPWIEPVDVSNALAWLCSEDDRYFTGVAIPNDAGQQLK
jgi:SDR family mycofactocin-dependent oxidoreductase